jgi:ArsR family transcriptional regulator, lead/cadmium/zinc/bismuth-responsive transcriptional repressor
MKEVSDGTCIRESVDEEMIGLLRSETYSNDHLIALSAFMSAAGNETRLRMLFVLWRTGELCVCDLADIFSITQPAVSRHLKILREKALVESRRDAQTIYYRVCAANPFARMLLNLFEEQAISNISLKIQVTT